jgi:hypothetical protein
MSGFVLFQGRKKVGADIVLRSVAENGLERQNPNRGKYKMLHHQA